MSTRVIIISGGIGSGKSTLATSLAKALDCPMTSFGSEVREVARREGLSLSREILQRLGETQVASDPDGFCNRVLSRVNWRQERYVVIEGLRHLLVYDCIKRIVSPAHTFLVYLDVSQEERIRRVLERGETVTITEADKHSTESDVTLCLKSAADVVVDATQTPEAILEAVLSKLRTIFVNRADTTGAPGRVHHRDLS